MKITELLTEKELKELKFADRTINRLRHTKGLITAASLFGKLLNDMTPEQALAKAAQEANLRPRELQLYLKDHGLMPSDHT